MDFYLKKSIGKREDNIQGNFIHYLQRPIAKHLNPKSFFFQQANTQTLKFCNNVPIKINDYQ